MTNLEVRPQEHLCSAGEQPDAIELHPPRNVPLGGARAMTVRRTLPSRRRSLIGPFCFADHYGPDELTGANGMDVPPHPHTGLQTVTWLFEGTVLHQDSLGYVQRIEPGQLNLMTAGSGICHSEEGTLAKYPHMKRIHGVQLWTALPEPARHGVASFEHVAQVPRIEIDDAVVQVFMGQLAEAASPAKAYSPLVAAQLDIAANGTVRLPVNPAFEHGVLLDTGELTVADTAVERAGLAYLAPGRSQLELSAGASSTRAVLMGGAPFEEDILMWWNFVARTHEEVVAYRMEWQSAIEGAAQGLARFGSVSGYDGAPLPAPVLPNVRLRPRGLLL